MPLSNNVQAIVLSLNQSSRRRLKLHVLNTPDEYTNRIDEYYKIPCLKQLFTFKNIFPSIDAVETFMSFTFKISSSPFDWTIGIL